MDVCIPPRPGAREASYCPQGSWSALSRLGPRLAVRVLAADSRPTRPGSGTATTTTEVTSSASEPCGNWDRSPGPSDHHRRRDPFPAPQLPAPPPRTPRGSSARPSSALPRRLKPAARVRSLPRRQEELPGDQGAQASPGPRTKKNRPGPPTLTRWGRCAPADKHPGDGLVVQDPVSLSPQGSAETSCTKCCAAYASKAAARAW